MLKPVFNTSVLQGVVNVAMNRSMAKVLRNTIADLTDLDEENDRELIALKRSIGVALRRDRPDLEDD